MNAMKFSLSFCLPCLIITTATLAAPYDPALHQSHGKMYSPEESLKLIEVPDGYHLEIVAAEPLINEPVLVTWDGNGRMYVAEMSQYMQDIDGKNQLDPVCQVIRLEDTNGDGRMDKRIVFADKLVLPRMVQCIDDWVIIRETNTLDLWAYRDTDGDGVSDEKKKVFEGGRRGGNLEHQPSGLDWNIDNWMYVTYTNKRYKWQDGVIIAEKIPSGTGQWGVTHDDVGRNFFTTAGGERPAHDFQHAFVYGKSSIRGEEEAGFREVFPLVEIPDVQGGSRRFRKENNTLNNFTGSAGVHIYRGDQLPEDLYGDVIIPEPVGRLIRRAKFINDHGIMRVKSATPKGTEFIRSRDANFRPLNAATGPDGCLYIVDMYRGIIQEGNWVRKGSYLRPIVEQYGLDKNIQKGRIYRLVHKTTQKSKHLPLLDATPEQLVSILAHPSGYYRDHAQKLLVARRTSAITPLLERMARDHPEPIARLHALWTLDGIASITLSLLQEKLNDTDPRVRAGAVRIMEGPLMKGTAKASLLEPLIDDKDMNVIIQLCLSLGRSNAPGGFALIERINTLHGEHEAVKSVLRSYQARIAEAKKVVAQHTLITKGKESYQALCFSCHGADGKGTPLPGQPEATLAPSLAGSPRLLNNKDIPIRIVLKGMVGELDGKTYPGPMLPLESYDDNYLAAVLSYVRNSFGNSADLITAQDVATVRKAVSPRKEPWHTEEILAMTPIPASTMRQWQARASHGEQKASSAFDGNPQTRFDTGCTQRPGMWFELDMLKEYTLTSLSLDTRGSPQDYPRDYTIQVSTDGNSWSETVAKGKGSLTTEITLSSIKARYLRINQHGSSGSKYWSIHEMAVYGQ